MMPEAVRASQVGAVRGPVSSAIFRVARSHKMLAGMLLADLGLYPGQELVVMMLGDTGPMEQKDLVAQLGTHASTVTKMVQRLERAGFVRRRRSTRDARGMMVELTEHGVDLARELGEVWAEFEQLTLAGLSEAQRKALLPALTRLERSIGAALRERQKPGVPLPPGD
jgi:DNA-binding MarR family transcriptional regulator